MTSSSTSPKTPTPTLSESPSSTPEANESVSASTPPTPAASLEATSPTLATSTKQPEVNIIRRSGTSYVNTPFTKRERIIIRCILEGMMNKNIAVYLDISTRTVEHARRSIMNKTRAKSAVQLGFILGRIPEKCLNMFLNDYFDRPLCVQHPTDPFTETLKRQYGRGETSRPLRDDDPPHDA